MESPTWESWTLALVNMALIGNCASATSRRSLVHGLDAGPHDLAAPFIEELAGPHGGVVIPELLKGFLKKVSADGLQIVAEQIAQPERASSRALFILATMWNRSRICRAYEHFSRMTFGYGSHLIASIIMDHHLNPMLADVVGGCVPHSKS